MALAALVFDAYGTLFDVHSVTRHAETLFPGRGAALSQQWRTKQLEYTWLTSLMHGGAGMDADFAAVTANALDYALESLGLAATGHERDTLLASYRALDPFPEAADALAQLAPRPRWILSNGSRAMLEPLVAQSALQPNIDGILTVEPAGTFKPSPRVYALAVAALAVPSRAIGFVSSNGWDAIGARAFGFTTFWINRAGAPVDRHGPPPDRILKSLTDLPAAVAGFDAPP
ncbi:MAG: haloacid dehalogenase type II [Casimicrobiaceae bacterium]